MFGGKVQVESIYRSQFQQAYEWLVAIEQRRFLA
jgi:hypothetical protein